MWSENKQPEMICLYVWSDSADLSHLLLVSFSFIHPSSASLHPSSSPLTHDDTDCSDMTKNIQRKETDDTNFLGVLVLQLSNEN